ncbi:MAG: hypothetical protein ACFCGT_15875 [Sandaracinaceae bacterium]
MTQPTFEKIDAILQQVPELDTAPASLRDEDLDRFWRDDHIAGRIARSPAARVRLRERRQRQRWRRTAARRLAWTGAMAAAAVLALVCLPLLEPASSPTVPEYRADPIEGALRSSRGGPASASPEVGSSSGPLPVFAPHGRLTFRVRPEAAVPREEILVEAWAAGPGGTRRPLAPTVRGSGVVEIRFLAADVFDRPGPWTVSVDILPRAAPAGSAAQSFRAAVRYTTGPE